MTSLNDRLCARAVEDTRDGIKTLTVAALSLPSESTARIYLVDIIRQLERLVPLAEKELRGECYVCRCCGARSFRPFGMDETICGPCHNGTHHDHEPTEAVALENQKRWGRPGIVLRGVTP